jgi:nucleotidyltransferase substrate binding protein (TIGR01987 family)
MEQGQDIRWKQRFTNYKKALAMLQLGLGISKPSETEKQGIIKSFEFTYELGWNLLKDYLEFQGEVDLAGARDCVRISFKRGLLSDGHSWMDMIQKRNLTSHTYNTKIAEDVLGKIRNDYIIQFESLLKKFETL